MSDTYVEKTGILSKLPEDGGNLGYLKISAPAAGTLTALGPEHHQAPTDQLPRASKETSSDMPRFGGVGIKYCHLPYCLLPIIFFSNGLNTADVPQYGPVATMARISAM